MSEISHVRDHLFLCFWFWCVVSFGLFRGFNIFMNRYSFDEDHGISMHTDAQAAYEEKDPITSISMRNGSLLMVSAKQKKEREETRERGGVCWFTSRPTPCWLWEGVSNRSSCMRCLASMT